MFDSRHQPFDAWWDALTGDQRRHAHDSIGHELNDSLQKSLVKAKISMIEAHLSDSNGGLRNVWLMPTAVAEFITSRSSDQRTPGSEQFRINARKVLDEFVADHQSSRVDIPVDEFATNSMNAAGSEPDMEMHPGLSGQMVRAGAGIAGQFFDLPAHE